MSAVLDLAEMRMRPMREADLDEVLSVERGSYPFPWSEGIFRDCLRVGYSCWVLEWDSMVHAYGIMQVAAGESHVLNLCVRRRFQGQGLGRFVLTHLIEVAQTHRADTILLEVRPSNRSAVHLYEDMGFNEVGIRRGYYPSHQGREDAKILARALAVD